MAFWQRKQHHHVQQDPQRQSTEVADLLIPTSIVLERDQIAINEHVSRILAITNYPRTVYPGWLDRLIDLNDPLDVSMFLHPQDSGQVVRRLSRRLVQLHSSRLLEQKQGRVGDAERSVAYSDVERTRDRVQRGDEKVFGVSIYLRADAPSRDEVAQRTARISAAVDNLQLVARSATYEQDLGLQSCLPEGRDRLARSVTLDTSSVATAFPFTSSGLTMESGILYGVAPNGSLIIVDPFASAMENANQVVFAKSGAGKSFSCKIAALRHLMLGTDVYIVDPEDEYRPLCDVVGGQFIRVTPGSDQHVNPFDLPPPLVGAEEGKSGDPLAEKVSSLHALLDLMLADRGPSGMVTLAQREKSLLDHALYETYRRVGITADRVTHDRPAPLMRDLYDVLRTGVCGQDQTGLADRLRRYVEGSLAGLFAAPTNVDLNDQLVVFGVRDLDAELRPLGLFMIADFVETRIRRQRKPRLLYIDEAWTLMQFAEGGKFLAGLARRARKYYLGVVTITQNVEDFLQNEHGRTVLAQSSLQVLLKQDASTIDAVTTAFHLSLHERQYLLGCQKGEGLLFAQGGHVPLHFEASALESQLATTDPRELAAREQARLTEKAPIPHTPTPPPLEPAHLSVQRKRAKRLLSDVGEESPNEDLPDTDRLNIISLRERKSHRGETPDDDAE